MGKLVTLVLAVALGAASGVASAAPARKVGRPFLGPGFLSRPELAAARGRALLVELQPEHAKEAAALIRAAGGRLISPQLRLWRLSPKTAGPLFSRLRQMRAVRGVEAERRLQRAGRLEFSDPLYPSEWWRAAIGADALSPPGAGVPITILDSGIDVTHPEFAGRPNVTLLNTQSLTDSPEDFHGTAVAGVAAAPANGVGIVGTYPTAAIQSWDLGTITNTSVIAGILEAADAAPSVINMSFGTTQYDPMIEQAILMAFGEGSILVAASGNEFNKGNPLLYPASLSHVLTVAATDEANKPSYFSSASAAVDLAAPGQDIVSSIPLSFAADGWETVNGTSFAAPMVSAATAWVWSVRRDLDNTQLFDLMRFSATDIWQKDFDDSTGFGLLNIPEALSEAAPSSDHQEPNDDIYMVKANGLFKHATVPLTSPGHGNKSLAARLDYTEDPEDVYRAWVPAHRVLRATVSGDGDVNLALWKPKTASVHERGFVEQRDLIGSSDESGTVIDAVRFKRASARGEYVYVDVSLGPDEGSASYILQLTTARR